MSNSFKKMPIGGHSGVSDKECKRQANRSFRRANKVQLEKFVEDYEPKFMEEIKGGNIWDFNKEGKQWFGTTRISSSPWIRDWTDGQIKKLMRK